jgi:2-desacetyl-2-hydroxyethyl bacteriochlorophyllide A dehydrogenase
MNTLTLLEPGRLVFGQTDKPADPAPGDALVRVHRVGCCGTDYHAFAGKQPYFSYPRILGHELGVEVVAVNDAGGGANPQHVKVGDRCSVEPYVNCQDCVACRRGKGNCCTRMRVIGVHTDGGMREFFHVPLRKLHPAGTLAYEQIALVETLAIGAHAVDRAAVEAADTVLVIGAGPIGLSVIQFAAPLACTLVMDVSPTRLAFCREKMNVRDTIDAKNNPVEALKELTRGDMATVVIDATGNAHSMNGAIAYLAHGGRLVFVGLHQGEFAISDPEFHRRETTLLGSRNAHPRNFSQIIRMMESRQLDTTPWITHRAPASEVAAVFPTWTRPDSGVLKAIIEF